jgi:hypothetical protein
MEITKEQDALYDKMKYLYKKIVELKSNNLTIKDIIKVMNLDPEKKYNAVSSCYILGDYCPKFPFTEHDLLVLEELFNELNNKNAPQY